MNTTVMMFTGQGSQRIGMGADVDKVPASRAVWDCAADIAGYDVRRLCWKGPMPRLSNTRYQQVAVTAVNLASYYALKAAGSLPEPAAFIGHSVGEYSALNAAGALSLEATFKAVQARADLMQAQAEASDGAMYAVKLDARSDVNAVIAGMGLAGQVVIANDNSPCQVVISGGTEAVKAVAAELTRQHLPSVRLAVNGAWHSPLMAGMLPAYGALLAALDVHMPQVPVLMNRSASAPSSVDEIRTHLTTHVVETVRWRETVDRLLARGHRHFLELGPRKILCPLLADHGEIAASVQASHCREWLKAAPAEAVAC